MIDLPADNYVVLVRVIRPALSIFQSVMDNREARCMLLAIGRQESGFRTREQVDGPARGLWQTQLNAIQDVISNEASKALVPHVCQELHVQYGAELIYDALLTSDQLACCIARLILWCDPAALPAVGACIDAWDCYTRCWRPGSPSLNRWRSEAYPLAAAITST